MTHQEKIVDDCLDDVLSQTDQNNIACNTMTIVYLLRENAYWTKRFSPLYAQVVLLSDVAHGQKNLTRQQLTEFAAIVAVSKTALLKRTGNTKQRHAYFHQLLSELGRFAYTASVIHSVDDVPKETLCTKPPKGVVEPESEIAPDEDFQLGSFLGDVIEETFSLGSLLD